MNPGRVAASLWLFNAALLGAVFLFAPGTFRTAADDRAAAQAQPKPAKRATWEPGAVRDAMAMPEVSLSPRQRPVAPVVDTGGGVTEIEPTDDELRAGTEAFIRKRYELQHTAVATDGRLPAKAILLAARLRVQVQVGMNLQSLQGTPLAAAAADVDVKEISADHVLLGAASQRRPARRFDVRLNVPQTSVVSAVLTPMWQPAEPRRDLDKGRDKLPSPAPPPAPEVDRKLAERVLEEAAKYVRVTEHGLQLTDELPEDSELYRRGARKGDILKAVNDKPVRTLAELRAVSREQYDAGTREFKIDYERAGVPMQRTVNMK
jgi:hypothetical protein